jgi:glutamine amidotransferase-like uncharacterized protein
MTKIAIYNGPGVSYELTVKKSWLPFSKNFEVSVLKYTKFTKKQLDKFDVVVLPGGSGMGINAGLGLYGRQNLIDWVSEGGTIIGVCAGFYSMVKGYEYSLGLLNYRIADRPNWRRGNHPVDLKLSEAGKKFFNVRRNMFLNVPYHNGPVVERNDGLDYNISNEEILAYFDTELIAEGSTKQLMKGSPAIIKNNYRNGLVIAISPHFEHSRHYKKIIEKIFKHEYNVPRLCSVGQ